MYLLTHFLNQLLISVYKNQKLFVGKIIYSSIQNQI